MVHFYTHFPHQLLQGSSYLSSSSQQKTAIPHTELTPLLSTVSSSSFSSPFTPNSPYVPDFSDNKNADSYTIFPYFCTGFTYFSTSRSDLFIRSGFAWDHLIRPDQMTLLWQYYPTS